MAQYPVTTDPQYNDIAQSINTLLSGPSGLGQNFAGFSAYTPAYLTGNYRIPFSQSTLANLYVPPIPLSTSEMLDGRTFKFTFSSPQSSIPFSLGSPIYINGVSDSFYNGQYYPIGVTECTTTYVVCRTNGTYSIESPSTGGTAEFTAMNFLNSTDSNARVTVTGATDRVFISAQCDQIISYTTSDLDNLTVSVQINRYKGFLNQDPTNPDYLFNFDQTVSKKDYVFNGLTGTGTLPIIEPIFATIIDRPVPGFYWYILELYFSTTNNLLQVTSDELKLRDLSAQVVKQ
jgi:hypothetical protein